jgi:hypothetical protein
LYATKDNTVYALDVKAGRAQLSNWQILRLAWLQEHAFVGGVVRVVLEIPDAAKLRNLYEHYDKTVGVVTGIIIEHGSGSEAHTMSLVKLREVEQEIWKQALELCRASSITIEPFDTSRYEASQYVPTQQQLQEAIQAIEGKLYGYCYQGDRDKLFLSLPMPSW